MCKLNTGREMMRIKAQCRRRESEKATCCVESTAIEMNWSYDYDDGFGVYIEGEGYNAISMERDEGI